MSIFEYNEEEVIKQIRADEYDLGKEAGIALGLELGRAAGEAAGIAKGKAEAVLELLEDLGEIPNELRSKVLLEKNPDILNKWMKGAARAESIQMFLDRAGLSLTVKDKRPGGN